MHFVYICLGNKLSGYSQMPLRDRIRIPLTRGYAHIRVRHLYIKNGSKENILFIFLAQRQSPFAKGTGFARANHHLRWWLIRSQSLTMLLQRSAKMPHPLKNDVGHYQHLLAFYFFLQIKNTKKALPKRLNELSY